MVAPNQFDDERQVLEDRFNTLWPTLGNTKIKWENAPWDEPKEDPTWVAFSIQTGPGDQISLGDDARSRYTGTVIIQVFQKERTGTGAANILAGQAADIFRRLEICVDESGLLRFRIPSKVTVGLNNGWFQINVICPYIRDQNHGLNTL